MPIDKRPNAEPIGGYRLIEKLGAGGFGEVWKCEAPGGIHKAIKFVYGNLNGLAADSAHADEELRAVQHIKSIRHPFLLSMDRVESIEGELVIITELADYNLHELWERYHALGHAGIPREELLGYLREAAEVLDLLNHKFDLQHLDIKPHNLFLVSNHVKVADFGLVNSLTAVGAETQTPTGAVTPLYAAPELFQGRMSRQCDQYSLAIVFQELLTGTLPFNGTNTRQLLLSHTSAEPDLSPLPEADRALVARALAKNPDHRFASCLDFIRTLQAERVPSTSGRDTDPEVTLATTPSPQATVDTVLMSPAGPAQRFLPPTPPPLPPGVLEGHRFLEQVSNGELAEVWKVQAPDGRKRLVQFLFGLRGPEKQLKERVARMQSTQHPALLSPEVAEVAKGRIVLVTDSPRETLRDRFQQCQARKHPGIMRGELVDYLRAAAEVLDFQFHQHNVQHLNLSPRSLILDNGWLQIAEFGYAQLLWLPDELGVGRRHARYAAPELFDGKLTRHCDQYSLALIYAEMLTGVHPFRGQSPSTYRKSGLAPDLAKLPELDRDVIARALRAEPHERWPSNSDMMLALEGTSPEVYEKLQAKRDSFTTLLQNTRNTKKSAVDTGLPPDELCRIIAQIIESGGGVASSGDLQTPALSETGDVLTYSFQVGLPLGKAQIQLDAYCKEFGAQMTGRGDASCVLELPQSATRWQRWRGQVPVLAATISMARVNSMSATPIEVSVRIEVRGDQGDRARALVERRGPELLEGLQKYLLINSEKRIKDRLLWPHQLTVTPIHADDRRDEPIVCRGKDLSQTGIAFYLPDELTTSDVLVQIPNSISPPFITVPATLVRAKPSADGWYEVGAIFRLPMKCKSFAELSVENPVCV